MKTTLSCIVLTGLSAGLTAQSTSYETSPRGLRNKPGDMFSTILGTYAEGRMQFADQSLFGRKMNIQKVSFRADDKTTYAPKNGMGRSWTNVTLTMAETFVFTMRNDWGNYRRAGTQVFSSAMTWKTLSGQSSKQSWGSVVPTMSLRKPYLHSGTYGMLMDFQFRGGKLANKATWSRNPYYLDGHSGKPEYNEATVEFVPKITTCNDSAFSHTFGARLDYYARVFADDVLSWPGHLTVNHSTRHTAPGATVLQVACLAGDAKGVAVNARCNRLYLNLGFILGMTSRKANSLGFSSFSQNNGSYIVKFDPAWTKQTLWYQGAWTDSKSGQFALTRATKVTLPAKPGLRNRRSLFRGGTSSRTGIGPSTYQPYQLLPMFTYN